jgi:hypothetical protein
MDPQAFALLMDRFDTIEKQNEKQIELIEDHVKQDNATRIIVERHTTYFGLMSLGLAPLGAYIFGKLSGKI